jgi:hypothetical protein
LFSFDIGLPLASTSGMNSVGFPSMNRGSLTSVVPTEPNQEVNNLKAAVVFETARIDLDCTFSSSFALSIRSAAGRAKTESAFPRQR